MWVVEAHSESETDLRGKSFTSGDIEIISGLEIIRGCAQSSGQVLGNNGGFL